eukprot:gene6024-4327_t
MISASMMAPRRMLCVLAILVLLLPSFASAQCGMQVACFPWARKACTRGESMNLRFVLDIAPEREWGSNNRYATYGFCPKVDQLASFSLNESAFFATGYTTTEKDKDNKDKEVTKYHFSEGIYKQYISAFGFGNTDSPEWPQRGVSNGAVVVAVNGSLTTCGGKSTVWVASTLMLNIGLRKGLFNYVSSSPTGNQTIVNPYYDLSLCLKGTHPPEGVSYCSPTIEIDLPADTRQPTYAGFDPTCKDGKCMFDSSAVCYGDEGHENCGYCYTTPESTLQERTEVWVSYFGTDSASAAMISGGNSPLRYMNFASNSLAQKFKDKLNALWNGDYAS